MPSLFRYLAADGAESLFAGRPLRPSHDRALPAGPSRRVTALPGVGPIVARPGARDRGPLCGASYGPTGSCSRSPAPYSWFEGESPRKGPMKTEAQAKPIETSARPNPWDVVAPRLRAAGLRWTSQRKTLVEVLRRHEGHVTATEIIARCREIDPTTTPSTVYRTLDVLEELGLVRHGHTPDGREEYHVLPQATHGHLHCSNCGRTWEIKAETGAVIAGRPGRGSWLRGGPVPRHRVRPLRALPGVISWR